MERRLTIPVLLGRTAALAAGLFAYHLLLGGLIRAGRLKLGAVSADVAPLYGYWRPFFTGWLVPPAIVVAAYLAMLWRSDLLRARGDRRAIAGLIVGFLLVATSVALIDGGPRELIGPMVSRPDLEYYGAIGRVGDPAEFLRHYVELCPTLPLHAQVHPPGAVLFVWAAARLLPGAEWGVAAAIIGVSSLLIVPVFLWARSLGGPATARRAGALIVLAPSVVLFSATSMDGPFAVALVATMATFWEALKRASVGLGLLAGLLATIAALMTYSITVVLVFCGLAALGTWAWCPGHRRGTVGVGLAALGAFAGLHLILWGGTGFDPIAMFRAAASFSHKHLPDARHETVVRHLHVMVGQLAVLFFAAGLPCAVQWWPAVLGAIRAGGRFRPSGPTDRGASAPREPDLPLFCLVALLTLLIAAAVPAYVMEVERLWMFLVPLVVIPVAAGLASQEAGTARPRQTIATAALLGIQTIVTEMLVTTYW